MFKNPFLLLVATLISLTPIQVQSEQVINFDPFSLPPSQVQNKPIEQIPGVNCLWSDQKLVKRINTNIVICQESATDPFKYKLVLYRFNVTNGVLEGLELMATMFVGNYNLKRVMMGDYDLESGELNRKTDFILLGRDFLEWVGGTDFIPDPQFLKKYQQDITLLLDTDAEIMSQTPNFF